MKSLYPATVYDRHAPIRSFWETTVYPLPPQQTPPLTHSTTCDTAIIGAGITGLSAALHLAQQGEQVSVLEAGTPGWGASGRNGGFCCVGATLLSETDLIRHFGLAETQRFFEAQREAIALVQQLTETHHLSVDRQGEGEIQIAHRASRWAELKEKYDFFKSIAQYPCELLSPDDLRTLGVATAEQYGGFWQKLGFGLNPLKYSRGLATAAIEKGISLYAHSPVVAWEKDAEGWHLLQTPGGQVRSRRVVLATNAYTPESLHTELRGRVLPIFSQIITTRPLTLAEREAQGWHTDTPVFDTRHLLFYFRMLADGRFLMGTRGDMAGTLEARDRITRHLQRHFQHLFPSWQHVEISHVWNGLLCATYRLTPHIGCWEPDPSVFYALGYHGNGVAFATWSGRAIAHLITQTLQPTDLCAPLRQPLQPFPLPGLRLWYLRATSALYSLQDRTF